MRTTVDRVLTGLVAIFGDPQPFPLSHRVLGAASLFADGTMAWAMV